MSDTNSNAVIQAWHFTSGDKLRDGTPVPPVGEWLHHDGPIVYCKKGLHASRRPLDALRYAPGSIIHRVECRRDVEEGRDKLVCRERRRTASTDIENLLRDFARFAAWTVLPLWAAPPVVREWLETGDEKLRAKAYATAAYATAAWTAPNAANAVADAAYYDTTLAVYAAANAIIAAHHATVAIVKSDAFYAAFETLLTDAVLARLGLEE